jgi:hypothetical protein
MVLGADASGVMTVTRQSRWQARSNGRKIAARSNPVRGMK